MNYQHTHVSVRDGSPAMVVWERDGLIKLMNEDGWTWVDQASMWRPM